MSPLGFLQSQCDECHVADSDFFFFIGTCATEVIKSPRQFGCKDTIQGDSVQMQMTNGPQVTSQTQEVRELGDSSQTWPSTGPARKQQGHLRAWPRRQPHRASTLFQGFQLLKPSLEQGIEPSLPEPSGKVWTHWQEN